MVAGLKRNAKLEVRQMAKDWLEDRNINIFSGFLVIKVKYRLGKCPEVLYLF